MPSSPSEARTSRHQRVSCTSSPSPTRAWVGKRRRRCSASSRRPCGRGAPHAPSEPPLDYDRTRLPEVYARARELPAEALATWRHALASMLPPAPAIRRVLDLGCGTGRFTGLLADLYGTTVIGRDPSHGTRAG